MIKKVTLTALLFWVTINGALANHALSGMDDLLAILFFIGFILLTIAIISIVLSFRAYKKNKTAHKVIGSILTIPFGVLFILLLTQEAPKMFSLIPLIIVVLNIYLISNAKSGREILTQKSSNDD